MGTQFHKLQKAKSSKKPRNFLFFDCESIIVEDGDGVQTHTLKMGCGTYTRDAKPGSPAIRREFSFYSANEFWDYALEYTESDRRLIIMAYNVGYDIRIVDSFRILKERGFKLRNWYSKGLVSIFTFKKGKQKVQFLDAMNFFDGKLEKWGDELGYPKLDIDFLTCTDKDLEIYCRRDVVILEKLFAKWEYFCKLNDCGPFSFTRASQSFTCFRHRFMNTGVFIHADKLATETERQSYHGGRTEAFFIGKKHGEKFYKVDINSMYPFIMRDLEVPTCLKFTVNKPSIKYLKLLREKYCLCGCFNLKTDKPIYPYKQDKKLTFPVGHFQAYLNTPEIDMAIERGHIRNCEWVCCYFHSNLFSEYVTHFYDLRQKYKQEGNLIFEQCVKIFMNSLYGKFGQLTDHWKMTQENTNLMDGEQPLVINNEGKIERSIVIAGDKWELEGKGEGRDSFVTIAGHVTSASRIYLWNLIEKAGLENCFYCDTDSLVVNGKGFIRLEDEMDNKVLGKLKLEYMTEDLEIFGCKDYKTHLECKTKGIRKNAIKVSPNKYIQEVWMGLRGAIRMGILDRVIVRKQFKLLTRQYTKGFVSSSGRVSPFVLDL